MSQINPQQKLNVAPTHHIHQQPDKMLNVNSNIQNQDQTNLNPHQNGAKIMEHTRLEQKNQQQIREQKHVESVKQLKQQQVLENDKEKQVQKVIQIGQAQESQELQQIQVGDEVKEVKEAQTVKDAPELEQAHEVQDEPEVQEEAVQKQVNKQQGQQVEEIQNNLSIDIMKQQTKFQKQKEEIEKNEKEQIHQEFRNEMKIQISYVEDKKQSQSVKEGEENQKQNQKEQSVKKSENNNSQLIQQKQIEHQVQQLEVEKNEENKEQSKGTHPQPIIMTQENQQQLTNTLQNAQSERKQKIVEFQEYSPNTSNLQIKSNIEPEESEVNVKQNKRGELPVQYQNIQNEQLLKRIQELQQTVSILKKEKQNKGEQKNQSNSDMQPGITATHTRTIDANPTGQKKKKKKDQIIHDQSVHCLVTQLAKTDAQGLGKKPILQQKRYKRRKLDLSSLMDKNMAHASNIFNVTIGQILNPNRKDDQQKQVLRKQIKNLRQKCLKLEEDKRVLSTQKPGIETRRETASTGKKSLCGRLIKVSELKGSRITGFEDNDSLYKVNQQLGETKSQRESVVDGITFRNKISNNSSTQRQDRQKDNPNNISFRVRRPSNRFNSGSNTPLNETFEKQKGNEIGEDQKISMFPVSSVELVKQKGREKKQSEKQIQIDKQWWQQPFIDGLQMPELPSPPTQFDSQQDLYTLGKLTFIAFGVDLNSSSQMTVKKYKNCVYFNAGQKNNILWYFDGRFYFGQWQVHLTGQGQKSGEGFEHVPGKFIYQGNFKEGKRNGFGTMKILNKQQNVVYEGNWIDGNKTGVGKQVDQYGVKYWGEWKQNKRQGFGRLKLQDGDYFEGNFQKGIKTGEGTQFFKNGDKYQGNYLANKFHGKGKYFWKNGSVYDGDFNHGIRSGTGKWKSSEILSEYDEYEGQYDNDKKNGYGKYRWADGSQYEGFFKDDLKEGQGTIRYKNGKVAKLLWKNGQPMKKIFSQEQKNYREGQKSKQKSGKQVNGNGVSRNQTISSRQFSLLRDQ